MTIHKTVRIFVPATLALVGLTAEAHATPTSGDAQDFFCAKTASAFQRSMRKGLRCLRGAKLAAANVTPCNDVKVYTDPDSDGAYIVGAGRSLRQCSTCTPQVDAACGKTGIQSIKATLDLKAEFSAIIEKGNVTGSAAIEGLVDASFRDPAPKVATMVQDSGGTGVDDLTYASWVAKMAFSYNQAKSLKLSLEGASKDLALDAKFQAALAMDVHCKITEEGETWAIPVHWTATCGTANTGKSDNPVDVMPGAPPEPCAQKDGGT